MVTPDDRAPVSSWGRRGRQVGRVGDSPLVGAGNYADDETGACSTTGHGEAMIRPCLAKPAVEGHARAHERGTHARADLTRVDPPHASTNRTDRRPRTMTCVRSDGVPGNGSTRRFDRVRKLRLLRGFGRCLAIHRVLKAATKARGLLDALLLQGRRQPLVPLPHAPDRAVRHRGRNMVKTPEESKRFGAPTPLSPGDRGVERSTQERRPHPTSGGRGIHRRCSK